MKQYKLINNGLGWLTFVVAAFTYLSTIESSASFWDCGEFITTAYKLQVGHPPGAPLFMLFGNLVTQLASDPTMVPVMVNSLSALFSALTILFLFWTITHLARRIVVKDEQKEMSPAQLITIMGCGMVGALAYTFSDTFWFSAVEGEVYAFSSLFTAVVFWMILKWEDVADQPHADRWIILIAYFTGLSIGVHLLNLLCIPAIVLVYYYKKFSNPTTKGTIITLLISFVIVGLVLFGVIQGLVEVCGYFELLFVNVFGMPYNSGVFAYVIIIAGVLGWAIWETVQTEIHETRMKIAFILSVVLLGIPFIGDGYTIAVIFTVALVVCMFFVQRVYKHINVQLLNTTLISLLVIVIGYSTYALILIRATADTPMNQNAPNNIFTLRYYLAREQYGDVPLIYGQTYVSERKYEIDNERGGMKGALTKGSPIYTRVLKTDPGEKDRYFISTYSSRPIYEDETSMLFPRMFSSEPRHVEFYKMWTHIKGETVRLRRAGEVVSVVKPTFGENLQFFFSYQLNWMYWRYFLWNFSGRQNDIQGHGGIMKGNAITGIKFIDEIWLGPQEDMPYDIEHNKGHNKFYMLPLLLGILGIFYQLFSGRKGIQDFWITFFLFFMTGIAIVLYLNQSPLQPRERDYAYAGSFYAYCIWIGMGVAIVVQWLSKYAKAPETVAATVASLICLLVPIQMVSQTWDDHDRSGRTVARDFGSNYLESCDENAILFTNGDNDTFPLWYAQEVEGIRTDVRVCNTSYLQTDWYIDQMKKQAYNSDPLPITWTKNQYIQGTRDFAYILKDELFPQMDLGLALEMIRSDDPRFKRPRGIAINQNIDYIPSDILVYKVDSAAVMRNNAISPVDTSRLLKEMVIDLSGKQVLPKEAITILDMLYTNNWKRPIYFAVTVDPSQFVRLDNYLQQTGLAKRITPIIAQRTENEDYRPVDTEKMYDNLMHKFKWGGVDKPGVYLDENVMNMCKNYRRSLFSDLAYSLMEEGEMEKAVEVLDRCMQVLPVENIPLDGSALFLGQAYIMAGEFEKGEQILNGVANYYMRSIRWIYNLKPNLKASVMEELRDYLSWVQYALQIGMENNPDFGLSFRDEFNNYRALFLRQTVNPANQ